MNARPDSRPKGNQADAFFKGYYMITSRCNLDCGYCVLEDAPDQLRRELDLAGKIDLIAHLYHRLGFRRLTLSGGEALFIGRRPPQDFLHLLAFLRTLRAPGEGRPLEVELYTNAVLLDDRVADAMAGVIDLVAITIDSNSEPLLKQIGRSVGRHRGYYERAIDACVRLSRRGVGVKLHSVVEMLNHESLGDEVRAIADTLEARGGVLRKWKFYQYMSYDDPVRDGAHAVTRARFERARERITSALEGRRIPLHFKDNNEMNESLFNILPYGNAQYMCDGDTWTTSRRTRDLREYGSIEEVLSSHDIDEARFRRYHQLPEAIESQ